MGVCREELRKWYVEKARREAELKAEMDGDMNAEAEAAFKVRAVAKPAHTCEQLR